jgi:hypothetical protein
LAVVGRKVNQLRRIVRTAVPAPASVEDRILTAGGGLMIFSRVRDNSHGLFFIIDKLLKSLYIVIMEKENPPLNF